MGRCRVVHFFIQMIPSAIVRCFGIKAFSLQILWPTNPGGFRFCFQHSASDLCVWWIQWFEQIRGFLCYRERAFCVETWVVLVHILNGLFHSGGLQTLTVMHRDSHSESGGRGGRRFEFWESCTLRWPLYSAQRAESESISDCQYDVIVQDGWKAENGQVYRTLQQMLNN